MKIIRENIRLVVIFIKQFYYTKIYGMNIAPDARISFGAKLDKTHPNGINIGSETYIASGALIFTHDFSRSLKCDTFIGSKCFIGANAIIMAGVRIGDEVVVGSGTIITKDVPSNVIVAGNPAKIVRYNIRTEKYGKILKAKD